MNEPIVYKMIKPRNEIIDWNQKMNILDKYENCKFLNVEFIISEIIKDIAKKCYIKKTEYYNLRYNEYAIWDPSQGNNSCRYFILDSTTFEYKNIGDKIITKEKMGRRGIYIHGTIDTNMVDNILNSLISNETKNKFRKFSYNVFAEKSNDINIFYDYNEALLSTWIKDTIGTILDYDAVVDSYNYYDNKNDFIKKIKNKEPRCVFIYTCLEYTNGTVKQYKSAEEQINDFKKFGCRNFIVIQNIKNINMYNLNKFRDYLKENKQNINSLCETKGNKKEINFVYDGDIFYIQGLLQADLLKWCSTKL